MSENIQLQQVGIDGMVIKMGRNNIRGLIVGRMLHRGEGIDVLTVRQYDDTAGMLSGGSVNTGTSCNDTVDLTVTFMYTLFFVIVFYITKSGFFRQRTYGAGTEGLPRAENYFRIFVGLTLVLTGEVQVDIRLLISLKSQKGLKGDIKSLFFQRFSAHRTVFIRHITAGTAGKAFDQIRIKIIIMTGFTIVVGMQRIYLSNTRHGGRKRRTDTASGAYKISVFVGLPHQFLGNDIHNRVPVGNNGVQFSFQTLLHDLRQLFAVDLMSPVVADVS